LGLFLVDFLVDTLISCAIFGVFVLFSWILKQTEGFGIISSSHLEAYELAHFWMNYGLFVVLGIAFLMRMVKALFVKR
jgi:hypothetical protein